MSLSRKGSVRHVRALGRPRKEGAISWDAAFVQVLDGLFSSWPWGRPGSPSGLLGRKPELGKMVPGPFDVLEVSAYV